MKISIYNLKGGTWKTTIATNLALEHDYSIGCNNPFPVYDGLIDSDRLLYVHPDEEFPLINDDIDIIFDLNGSITKWSKSIISAISQSDVVIVPICNDDQTIEESLYAISEILYFNTKLLIIWTKLKMRGKDDVFKDWEDCEDMKAIRQAVHLRINPKIPVLPLQYSPALDLILDEGKSLTWLANASKLEKPYFKKLLKQWDNIGFAIQGILSNSS